MGKFKKGLCLGSLLGASLMWLTATKKGRETRGKILDHTAEIYALLKKEAKKSDSWKKMTKTKYAKLVKKYVDKYAIQNGLSDNVKKTVEKLLVMQWKDLKCEDKCKK